MHHQFQPVYGNALEIARVIIGRKRIVAAAVAGNGVGQFTRFKLVSRLEHQMLKKMRNTGLTGWFVRSPDTIPDHMNHRRRPVVFENDHLHPVVQSKIGNLGRTQWPG